MEKHSYIFLLFSNFTTTLTNKVQDILYFIQNNHFYETSNLFFGATVSLAHR